MTHIFCPTFSLLLEPVPLPVPAPIPIPPFFFLSSWLDVSFRASVQRHRINHAKKRGRPARPVWVIS